MFRPFHPVSSVATLWLALLTPPGLAHQMDISDQVGAMLHIEPADNPRAGEKALAWFALTRKGGVIIPLSQCQCELQVYRQPRRPQDVPLLMPALKAVTAESYQGIPAAELTFPQPGIYDLELQGKPIGGASFQPFQLKFTVTVATGVSNSTALVPTPATSAPAPQSAIPSPAPTVAPTQSPHAFELRGAAIALAVTGLGIGGFILVQRQKK